MADVTRGQLTFTRFTAPGIADSIYNDRTDFDRSGGLTDLLRVRKFSEIRQASDIERSSGFCDFQDPLALDPYARMLGDDRTLGIGFRVDTLKIPSNVLKARTAAECRRLAREQQRDPKLTKRERDEIKQRVRLELRAQSLPKMAHFQAILSVEDEVLHVLTASGAVLSDFVDAWEKATGLPLGIPGLVTLASAAGVSDDALAVLEPERFHLTAA